MQDPHLGGYSGESSIEDPLGALLQGDQLEAWRFEDLLTTGDASPTGDDDMGVAAPPAGRSAQPAGQASAASSGAATAASRAAAAKERKHDAVFPRK